MKMPSRNCFLCCFKITEKKTFIKYEYLKIELPTNQRNIWNEIRNYEPEFTAIASR